MEAVSGQKITQSVSVVHTQHGSRKQVRNGEPESAQTTIVATETVESTRPGWQPPSQSDLRASARTAAPEQPHTESVALRQESGGFANLSDQQRVSYRNQAIELDRSGRLYKDDGKGGLVRAMPFDLFESLEYGAQDPSIPPVFVARTGTTRSSGFSSSSGSSYDHYSFSGNHSYGSEGGYLNSADTSTEFASSRIRRWSDLDWLGGGSAPNAFNLSGETGTINTHSASGGSSSQSHEETGFWTSTTRDSYSNSSWWNQ